MEDEKGQENKTIKYVKWFSELSNKDISIAGGKGASLSEMYNNKFPIPPGFVVTAQAYQYFIEKAGYGKKIIEALKNLDIENTEELQEISKKIKSTIKNSSMPKDLENQIIEAYEILDVNKKQISQAHSGALEILKTGHEPPFVAVRSSATTEDLVDASFAGQQESFLNVKGEKELISYVKACFASLFTPRAIYYRQKKGFPHDKSFLAVVVQKMIDSEKSGVIFSKNPTSNDSSIVIEAVWGLGEGIVSGKIKPDNYIIDNNIDNFKIKDLKISEKKIAIVRDSSGNNETVKLSAERSKKQVLNNYEIKRLAQYALNLETHYKKPQDIEFAIEGPEIYIVQSRPITTLHKNKQDSEIKGEIILSGLAASPGISSGVVRIVHNMDDLKKVKPGDVLVTEMTNPDMVVSMQKSIGIVTDEGGITSHAAIISREMGIPAVVGTGEATTKLKEGQVITVDGNSGNIFEGRAQTKLVEIKPIVATKTKIKVIVDLPDFASRAAKSESKSVGLIRLEGIIASSGKHPLSFIKENKIEDYIAILVAGLTKIAQPFDEIWIRSSDIRTDEFRHLQGSPKEVEGNPMLGDHGIRFSLKHPDVLKAELTAIKEIADEYSNKKIGLMAPQIISVIEVKQMKALADQIGMPKNVKIGIMVETPAAVQIINDLCNEGIDFISFGTNDLTQYTLAIDRNNSDVQNLYNEMNPAVLNSIAYVIRRCKKYNVETSLCGQAGSREDMVKFLIQQGIDSISVNADAANKISILIAKLEKEGIRDIANQQNQKFKQKPKPSPVPQKEIPENEPQIQHKSANPLSEKDMEDLAINELEKSGIPSPSEYMPGLPQQTEEKQKNIPPLNDAIPVESSHFQANEEEKILDIGSVKESNTIDQENNDANQLIESSESPESKEKKDYHELTEEWKPVKEES